MPIYPLPQFESDVKQLEEEDRKLYESMKAPKTVVVRFGAMKMIGEFPYDGTVKPGCGSKLVVRTFRGTELGEMLTSTCPNSGCSKSVSRQDMLQYIENSGGKDYPFYTEGKAVRLATKEDLDRQAAIEQSKHELRTRARAVIQRMGLDVKIVELEPIIGGERLTAYYLSEHRLELHHVARELSQEFHARVDMRQVGARDEARLTADYEKCGQYCCCKNFLKVLKPVSMKAAKTQKATLEPLKISGRCGRLMCCLRYEEQTYDDLKARLPRRKTRVGTAEGDGTVVDGQILTQLVLVELDDLDPSGNIKQIAVAVEELAPPKNQQMPPRPAPGSAPPDRRGVGRPGGPPRGDRGPRPNQPGGPRPQGDGAERREGGSPNAGPGGSSGGGGGSGGGERGPRPPHGRGRPGGPDQRQDRSQRPPRPAPPQAPAPPPPESEVMFDEEGNEIKPGDAGAPEGDRFSGPRRRRRRRGRGGPGGPGGPGGNPGGPSSDGPGPA